MVYSDDEFGFGNNERVIYFLFGTVYQEAEVTVRCGHLE
jgi:hypothetical protein